MEKIMLCRLGGALLALTCLLAQSAAYGQPLVQAAAAGDHARAQQLLAANVGSLTATDGEGDTALIAAARGGHAAVVELLLRSATGNLEGRFHEYIDRMNRAESTALYEAVQNQHVEVVRLLARYGARVGVRERELAQKSKNGALLRALSGQ